jgi:hypothetical protein
VVERRKRRRLGLGTRWHVTNAWMSRAYYLGPRRILISGFAESALLRARIPVNHEAGTSS